MLKINLSNFTLFVALALSTVAAYYSIIGLTAIFAGAVIPIIIMGSILEVTKITTSVWLRKYWERCSWKLKAYLIPAVVAIAILTSMGIFGFLSKAHMEQGAPIGDIAAKVALFDEKIKTQKDTVDSARAALAQMDAQVNNVMSKGDSERSVERSVQIRRQQAKERAQLQAEIERANAEIAKLNEERAPIASELRKVELEVGPVKYIAALIYGDNIDQNLLEKSVRWVIILLVLVFDPLAISLVLAANQSKEWDKEDSSKNLLDKVEPTEQPIHVADKKVEDNYSIIPNQPVEPLTEYKQEPELPKEKEFSLSDYPYLSKPWVKFPSRPEPIFRENKEELFDTGSDIIQAEDHSDNVTKEVVIETEGVTEKLCHILPESDYVERNGKQMHKQVFVSMFPELKLNAEDLGSPRADFGTKFPEFAFEGDIFVRVDTMPNKIFRFNGKSWIEVDKESDLTEIEKNLMGARETKK
jgi:hypothetical protein